MNTKDFPGRVPSSGESPPGLLVALERPVPVLALPGFTLFPGTLVPLSAFEPEPCRTLAECLADRRLLVLAAIDEPGPERPLFRVAGLGRIVSDRRHADGRIDAFIHGLARVALTNIELGPHGLVADVALLPDVPSDATVEPGVRLIAVASSLRHALATAAPEEAEALSSLLCSTEDLGQLTYRIASTFVRDFADRQALLEQRCPAARCDELAAHLGTALLMAAPVDVVH